MKKQKHISLLCSLLLLGFILSVHNGQVALYKDQDPEPYRVFPCKVSSLPPAVQLALRTGIPVDSPEQLKELIEKYLAENP